ncbi:MG2 domain-containing protein [Vitiosangium sp. GDMCC 1.1324]|uniref:MG2 domain-containing protein n=1 Tax=Vitiosangium sp. (strain GDMCC 1.1324) TaxID=2138576 RepID=UPI000D374555|nr:MG2 domain-containing protein [Vitiosangium sp. GDMCC 1.1324]PTL84062.1 A-macroglobulin complement component [Vitiosangium sp. GDMCC 1.1324]
MLINLAPRALVALLAMGLAVPVTVQQVLGAKADTPSLGGPNRYLTFVSTDKPLYRPGEQVLARGLMLEAIRHTPSPQVQQAQIEIRGPKGDVVTSASVQTQDSVWGYTWTVPAEQPGGEYTLKVSYPWSGEAPAERKFDVRAYRAPRLKSQIEFLRDGYGPGDTVTATLDVKRAEGGVPTGAKVTATAVVDGATAAQVAGTVNDKGLCTVSFKLPARMARGEGSLAFAIEDGGVVETAAKTIPILLQTLDLALYPEAGELVAGLPSRVYFEAKTPAQKPADLVGAIIDQATGQTVATVRSEHEGRGRFELTPRAGAKYALRIDEPSGIQKTFPLPEVKAQGAVLRASEDVVPAGRPVTLSVGLSGPSRARLTLSKREVEVASAEVGSGDKVTLDPKDADGVLVATVWDPQGRPLAERLVFRQPAKALNVEVQLDKKSYVPGDTVQLTARTTRDGKPVSALVMLTVTDDSVLELIEKRDQAPQLPVMVLLEPEVKELADAQVYLDEKNPKAKLAVDLLLGTQGWRRFSLADPVSFVAQHGDPARRVFAVRVPVARPRFEEMEDMPMAVDERADFGPPAEAPRPMPKKGMAVPAAPPMAVARPAPRGGMPPPAQAPALPAGQAVPLDRPAPQAGAKMAEASRKAERAKRDMDLLAADEVLAKRAPYQQPMVYIREYAHTVRPGRKAGDRLDFSETLFWNAGVRTSPQTGEAKVSFGLNDSVTSFKAFAGTVGDDGALGAAVASIESVQPFYVEPKIPLEVTSGDVIQLPVALVNGTSAALKAGVKLDFKGDMRVASLGTVDLAARERARRIVEMKIGQESKPIDLQLTARAGEYADTVTRTVTIKPNGFPIRASFGGTVSAQKPASHTVTLPANVVRGSVKTSVVVYPSPLANMTESLARLIQEPSGCFEQTSSTTYPMTMAQQYFQSHSGVDPKLVAAAREKLETGYKRLVGFECSEKGYEWFGENPGHEALTAFGLLHFTEMKQVRDVDAAMLERTRAWLLRQRDGKGGFERKRRALHTWIEDKDTSDAYITWALLESASRPAELARELSKEVASLKAAAAKSQNSYVLALAANVMSLAGDGAEARKLMERLAAKQSKEGVVGGSTQSIVGSMGETLDIETTALAVLAWLREPSYAGNVERSMKYLASSCEGGRYGSTQSTVLALRAIVAYDKARAAKRAGGEVRVYVNGQPVGNAVKYEASAQEAIKLPDVSELLTPGERKIELRMEGGAELPYSIEVTYNALVPASSPETRVALEVALAKTDLTEGEPTEARVLVSNKTDEKLPTAVAIFGVPGGLEVRHDQLKELVKKKTVDAYEVIGRDVVLYWRGLEPRKKLDVPVSLIAAVPGTYTGPASRAYLYYADEHKAWINGVKVSIVPKQ